MASSSHRYCKFFPIFGGQRIELGLEGFHWIFFDDIGIGIILTVVKVNEVGHLVVLVAWTTFGAIAGIMSFFSTLEAGV